MPSWLLVTDPAPEASSQSTTDWSRRLTWEMRNSDPPMAWAPRVGLLPRDTAGELLVDEKMRRKPVRFRPNVGDDGVDEAVAFILCSCICLSLRVIMVTASMTLAAAAATTSHWCTRRWGTGHCQRCRSCRYQWLSMAINGWHPVETQLRPS